MSSGLRRIVLRRIALRRIVCPIPLLSEMDLDESLVLVKEIDDTIDLLYRFLRFVKASNSESTISKLRSSKIRRQPRVEDDSHNFVLFCHELSEGGGVVDMRKIPTSLSYTSFDQQREEFE
jgi:hypothetical protein